MLTIPFWLPLARFFFDNGDQFAEDLGVTTPEGRWALLMDYFGVNYRQSVSGLRSILLTVVGFFVVWASLLRRIIS